MARAEVPAEDQMTVSMEMVEEALRGAGRHQASMRLPRMAARAHSEEGKRLTWALVNLIALLGVTPSYWMREVTPIRKHGVGPVADDSKLRPISYVDDLENLFDALWLQRVKQNSPGAGKMKMQTR